jgi:uncharacterized protein
LFGKGGSAIATPILHFAGVPALIAVASPLPATIPSTIVASLPYWRAGFVDKRVITYGAAFGMPAAAIGAVLTNWANGPALILVTDVVILALAVRIFIERKHRMHQRQSVTHNTALLATVAVGVGLVAGLLANSGGFLLAPLFIVVLGMATRNAFGSSLALATIFAIPGTVVHAALGHIDWYVTGVFAVASVPLAAVGARVALRTHPQRLEWMYAVLLTVVSASSLVQILA